MATSKGIEQFKDATGGSFDSSTDWSQAFYDFVNSMDKRSYTESAEARYNYLASMAANQFTTSEREAAQDFEEYYYNTYSSPSAMVEQYQAAGLNPALMYGSAGASTGDVASSTGGSASQASALQHQNDGLNVVAFLNALTKGISDISSNMESISRSRLNQKQLDWYDARQSAEISNIESSTTLNSANTILTNFKSQTESKQKDLIDASINNLVATNDKIKAEIEGIGFDNMQKYLDFTLDSIYKESERQKDLQLKDFQAALMGQQTRSTAADAWLKEWDNKFYKLNGFHPNMTLQTYLGNLIPRAAGLEPDSDFSQEQLSKKAQRQAAREQRRAERLSKTIQYLISSGTD